MSIRDTKFQGFAKALLKELVDDMLDEYGFMDRSHYESGDLNTAEELITRRAYDLAEHVLKSTDSISLGTLTTEESAQRISDLPELPDDDKRYTEMQNAEEQEEGWKKYYDILPTGQKPIKISFTTSEGKKYEGIAFYKGDAKEQE